MREPRLAVATCSCETGDLKSRAPVRVSFLAASWLPPAPPHQSPIIRHLFFILSLKSTSSPFDLSFKSQISPHIPRVISIFSNSVPTSTRLIECLLQSPGARDIGKPSSQQSFLAISQQTTHRSFPHIEPAVFQFSFFGYRAHLGPCSHRPLSQRSL